MSRKKSHNKASSAKAPAPKPARDQYHHIIPRFILRRYQVGPALSNVERNKAFQRDGFIPEYVLFFDIATNTLDTRLLGEVYGAKNLYRDISNADDVNHIETKLAQLEQRAATSIADIHKSIPSGKFTLTRAELENLRKFLFVMHIRNVQCSQNYFNKELNPGSDRFIEAWGKKHGAHTPVDMWIQFIRYLVDTPHGQILLDGGELTMKGLPDVETLHAHENAQAVAYEQQANWYYLGVWEAASTDEFVLTSSSFGLWEGFLIPERQCYVHRLYILSPRLVVVLRLCQLRPESPDRASVRSMCRSDLVDLPLAPAESTYTGPPLRFTDENDMQEYLRSKAFSDYKMSPAGQRDTYAFKFNKLTPEQTLAVNRTILENTRADGSLTFASKSLMARTLQLYLRGVRCWDEHRDSYKVLLECLVQRPRHNPCQSLDDGPLQDLMTVILQADTDISGRRSWYACGAAVVGMPRLVGEQAPSDMAFAVAYGAYVLFIIFHLYSNAPPQEVYASDLMPVARPMNLTCEESTRLIHAARPLLRAAVPSCACTAESTDAERVLEAAVIVSVLDAAVVDLRLRLSLRERAPALAEYLYVGPGSPLLPHDVERIEKDLRNFARGAIHGRITSRNWYERARTLHTYFLVLEDSVPGRSFRAPLSQIIARLQRVLRQLSPGFVPPRHVRPKGRVADDDADALLGFLSALAETIGARIDQHDMSAAKRIQYDATLYGLLDWIVKHRYDFFEAAVEESLYGRPASTFVDYY
ncbi:uncharacterized protein SCHCODRAFT_02667966 [Schizophyllum commune H4-8]|nr:uncharacterized protein SCHCODRAFT_02667966 [Schizophyllum commune H4-8]KAI5892519.1 hypothetical protein SCHCODRAFT_02667966 [Schizophyllum commune H4-8]